MNLLDARVVLRLRSVPDILDLAFRYASGWTRRLGLRLAALVLLPCLAVCLGLRYSANWSWGQVWLTAIALGGVVQGVFTAACGQLLFSDQVTARSVLGRFVRRLPSYLVVLALGRFLLISSTALFLTENAGAISIAVLLLMIYAPLWVRSLFVHEVSLLEGASPGQALARSARFIKRQAGASLGLLCALVVAQVGFVGVAELLGQGIVEDVLQLGRPLGTLWPDGGSVYALVGFFLSIPYVASARFLKYTDIRTRKEGWDIQLKFTAIQAADQARRGA